MSDNELIRRGDALFMCDMPDAGTSGDYRAGQQQIKACLKDTIAALPAVAASQPADPVIKADSCQRVTVKPLVWHDVDTYGGTIWDAVASGVVYRIVHKSDGKYWLTDPSCGTTAPTLQAAKAAAQADYEDRILAAIDMQPDHCATAREALMVENIEVVSDACRAFKISEPLFLAALRMIRRDGVGQTPDPRDAVIAAAAAFDSADWYWRTMDPDDSGETPNDAICRGNLGQFCVCEIASSYRGPTRYGFLAPTLDPESDDEEFVHFATHDEAMLAAKTRAIAAAKGGAA
jgi:hypothetical protein